MPKSGLQAGSPESRKSKGAVHPNIMPITRITQTIHRAHPGGKINWKKNKVKTVTPNKANIKAVYWANFFPRTQLNIPKAIKIIAKTKE